MKLPKSILPGLLCERRSTAPDSPADDAGLRCGDVVLEINHDQITSPGDFQKLAHRDRKAEKLALPLVERGNATMFTVINSEG